jgi:hypothetical protein
MDDNQLDLMLQAHFKEKIPLENSLALKTKQRLWEKAERQNNLMFCFIQVGFLLAAITFGTLAIISFGFSVVVLLSLVGYFAIIGLIGSLMAFAGLESMRRIKIYE